MCLRAKAGNVIEDQVGGRHSLKEILMEGSPLKGVTPEETPAGESSSSGEDILGGGENKDKHPEGLWAERSVGPESMRRLETGARHLKAMLQSLHFILKSKGRNSERERGSREAPRQVWGKS